MLQQLLQQKVRPLWALALDHGGQGVHPFTGFLAVGIVGRNAEGMIGCCRHVYLLWLVANFNTVQKFSHKIYIFSNNAIRIHIMKLIGKVQAGIRANTERGLGHSPTLGSCHYRSRNE